MPRPPYRLAAIEVPNTAWYARAVDEPLQFLVEQDRFSGTLGELAHALRTHALDPSHIDLYQLVRSYLAYFEEYAAADLDLATEAMPRLAQVIELKVRLLLPRPPRETEDDEEALVEETLAAVALLEELEEAIHFLRRRREERRLLLPARTPTPSYPRQERPVNSTPKDLARLAGRYRIGGYFELAIERLSLASVARMLMNALRRLRTGTLRALLGSSEWPVRTVGLAALMELMREGRVSATQEEPYGDIEVRLVRAEHHAGDQWDNDAEKVEAPAA